MSISSYSVCSGLEITTKSLIAVNFIDPKLRRLFYLMLFSFISYTSIYLSRGFTSG